MYTLDRNGPIIAKRMRQAAVLNRSSGAFNVVTCAYNGESRIYPHRTLKSAFRKLASVISGKLRRRGEFAAAIVTPDLFCMNYREAKTTIASEGKPNA